jgi:RNA polymerase sigma factor (sigma-70 family)
MTKGLLPNDQYISENATYFDRKIRSLLFPHRAWLPNLDEARRDVFSDFIIKARKSFTSFDQGHTSGVSRSDEQRVEAWLHQQCVYAALDYVRRAGRESRSTVSLDSKRDADSALDALGRLTESRLLAPSESPEELLLGGERSRHLHVALRSLSDVRGSIVLWRYGDDMLDDAEVAARLGMSVVAVRQERCRALRQLSMAIRCLEAEPEELVALMLGLTDRRRDLLLTATSLEFDVRAIAARMSEDEPTTRARIQSALSRLANILETASAYEG